MIEYLNTITNRITRRFSSKKDYLIVGSGLFGSVCAHELTSRGYSVVVIEARDHIGGNCYTQERDDIHLHYYGPHIFHTSNRLIWDYVNRHAQFNNIIFSPVANYQGQIYALPFNMHTFAKMWNISTPAEAKAIIDSQKSYDNPSNLEQQAISLVGTEIYNKLIKGYTEKQWRKSCDQLPKEIIKRLPVRFTYNNNYFNDVYQGMPIGGYTQIFESLLYNIEVHFGVNYLANRDYWDNKAHRIIYTGAIDAYFEYQFGALEYKTTRFEHQRHNTHNLQGTAVINYTDINVPYTRTIEHKHFDNNMDSPVTWITTEYPDEYKPKITEPYYPVNDKMNNSIYNKYKILADNQPKTIFGGRLAEYKYYDMHNVIESALNTIRSIT